MTETGQSSNSILKTFTKCLSQQLSEIKLLKSMYPNNDELIFTDHNIIKDIEKFLDNKSDFTPNHLDFTVNIFIRNMKLEICINLPTLYPEEEPDIYVRCNQLNRHQESELNAGLSDYIKNNHLGEVFIYNGISWLQDNIDNFMTKKTNHVEINEINNLNKDKFVRLWVYSHHIYNKKKREDILKKCKELKLTGFCLPGKPGIICVEGFDSDCREWWKYIKSLSWKKIVIRNTEIFELSEQKMHQKFSNFEEVVFKNPYSQSTKHSDMSAFHKYMEEHGLIHAFNNVFGFGNDL